MILSKTVRQIACSPRERDYARQQRTEDDYEILLQSYVAGSRFLRRCFIYRSGRCSPQIDKDKVRRGLKAVQATVLYAARRHIR